MSDARPRTHEVVLRHVEDELVAGRLQIGGRLPAERAFADQLGVSRPSVREAIRVLEAMGVVRTSVGSGPEAGAVIVAEASTGITSALRLHLAASSLLMPDLVQTRVLLESWSVAQAARAPEQSAELAAAAALLDAMDAPDISPVQFHRLDAEFHVKLSQAGGNEVVASIMSALRGAIQDYVLAAVPALPDWSATARRMRRQHRNILAAVLEQNPERASRLVVRHIEGFYREAELAFRP